MPNFHALQLESFIVRAFGAAGLPSGDAKKIAGLMVQADLRGADAHGIFRLPQYIRRIRAGGMNVRPKIRAIRETDVTALVDGDNGMGHLVMEFATRLAMTKAEAKGIGWVGARNSNHAGPAALYAMMPLERDMIGVYLAVGNANYLPPSGGIERLLGTNPIAVAIPALEEPPIVLDAATSVAAYGKVRAAAQRGEKIPEGWMVDASGQPLTDPKRADEGFLLPIGGYKGYGLALVFGILAGTLNGAAFGRDVVDFNADHTTPTNTGQAIVALKVEGFSPVEAFKRSVDAVIRDMRTSKKMPGVDRIWLPGEQSHAKLLARTKTGVPIGQALFDQLLRVAADLKIEPLTT